MSDIKDTPFNHNCSQKKCWFLNIKLRRQDKKVVTFQERNDSHDFTGKNSNFLNSSFLPKKQKQKSNQYEKEKEWKSDEEKSMQLKLFYKKNVCNFWKINCKLLL